MDFIVLYEILSFRTPKLFDSLRTRQELRVRDYPDRALSHSGLGYLYAKLGMKESALNKAHKAITLMPDFSYGKTYIRYRVTGIFITLGKKDKAFEQIQAGI